MPAVHGARRRLRRRRLHAEAVAGQEVQNHTAELDAHRKTMLQMLFVEGNHFCPSCEKSGQCLLQATAYAIGMEGPHFDEFYPDRKVDASHPHVLLDFNRCILCGLCVRASREIDRKDVFAIGGHGLDSRLIVNSESGRLGDTDLALTDRAATSARWARSCPSDAASRCPSASGATTRGSLAEMAAPRPTRCRTPLRRRAS